MTVADRMTARALSLSRKPRRPWEQPTVRERTVARKLCTMLYGEGIKPANFQGSEYQYRQCLLDGITAEVFVAKNTGRYWGTLTGPGAADVAPNLEVRTCQPFHRFLRVWPYDDPSLVVVAVLVDATGYWPLGWVRAAKAQEVPARRIQEAREEAHWYPLDELHHIDGVQA